MRVADVINIAAKRFGYSINRYKPAPAERRKALLDSLGVRSVIDVGANIGQYGTALRRSGYSGQILSIEPLSAAFQQLDAHVATDAGWACRNVALSHTSYRAHMHVATNSASSSLMEMAPAHVAAAPHVGVSGTEEVNAVRLDEMVDLPRLPGPLMLKIDVQGHELSVIQGAAGVLSRIACMEVELSIRELYRGAPLLHEVVATLDALGYKLVGLEPGFPDVRDGAVLQFDGLFVRDLG